MAEVILTEDQAAFGASRLFFALLVDRPKRGRYIIIDKGKQVLLQFPQRIYHAFLMENSTEYREWFNAHMEKWRLRNQ